MLMFTIWFESLSFKMLLQHKVWAIFMVNWRIHSVFKWRIVGKEWTRGGFELSWPNAYSFRRLSVELCMYYLQPHRSSVWASLHLFFCLGAVLHQASHFRIWKLGILHFLSASVVGDLWGRSTSYCTSIQHCQNEALSHWSLLTYSYT